MTLEREVRPHRKEKAWEMQVFCEIDEFQGHLGGSD